MLHFTILFSFTIDTVFVTPVAFFRFLEVLARVSHSPQRAGLRGVFRLLKMFQTMVMHRTAPRLWLPILICLLRFFLPRSISSKNYSILAHRGFRGFRPRFFVFQIYRNKSTSNIISYFDTSANLYKKMLFQYFSKGWSRKAVTIFAVGSNNQSMPYWLSLYMKMAKLSWYALTVEIYLSPILERITRDGSSQRLPADT